MPVGGQELGTERLGKRDVARVVRGEVLAERDHGRHEPLMAVPCQGQIHIVLDRVCGAPAGKRPAQDPAAKTGDNLDVAQRWGV